ncbi:MAG: FHA domain-containing protein [Chloroflexi bacterium]|nr:FHA domain-containing protein [Chloroflexota bacterium]
MAPALQLPEGHLVHISADNFVVGADAGCDLRLNDDKASSRHVIIQRADVAWQIALLDLEAVAFLNDKPISGIVQLHDGDILKIGDTLLRWVEGDEMPPPLVKRSHWMLGLLVLALFLMLAVLLTLLTRPFLLEETPSETVAAATSPPPTATVTPPVHRLAAPSFTPTPASSVVTPNADLVETPSALVSPTAIFFPSATPSILVTPVLLPLVKTSEETERASTPESHPSPLVDAGPTVSPDEDVVPTPLPSTSTISPSAVKSPNACPQPTGWKRIVVQEGENLLDIALRYRISRARLARGNCLLGYALEPGQVLYVPRTD